MQLQSALSGYLSVPRSPTSPQSRMLGCLRRMLSTTRGHLREVRSEFPIAVAGLFVALSSCSPTLLVLHPPCYQLWNRAASSTLQDNQWLRRHLLMLLNKDILIDACGCRKRIAKSEQQIRVLQRECAGSSDRPMQSEWRGSRSMSLTTGGRCLVVSNLLEQTYSETGLIVGVQWMIST